LVAVPVDGGEPWQSAPREDEESASAVASPPRPSLREERAPVREASGPKPELQVEVPAPAPPEELSPSEEVDAPPVDYAASTDGSPIEFEAPPDASPVDLEGPQSDPSAPDLRSPADPSVASGAERFGRREPHERARHLARVLVSDIIAYYPVKYRESFDRGTLQEDFRSEVERSWKEYVDQVGREMAERTSYFTDALNQVLGKGKHRF